MSKHARPRHRARHARPPQYPVSSKQIAAGVPVAALAIAPVLPGPGHTAVRTALTAQVTSSRPAPGPPVRHRPPLTPAQRAYLHRWHLLHLAHERHLAALRAVRLPPRPWRPDGDGDHDHDTSDAGGVVVTLGSHYPSGTLSPTGLAQLWALAGGNPAAAATASCIAMHESGGSQFATGGVGEEGYFQINPVNNGLTVNGYTIWASYDPLVNARDAIALSYDGANWSAWTTAPMCGA